MSVEIGWGSVGYWLFQAGLSQAALVHVSLILLLAKPPCSSHSDGKGAEGRWTHSTRLTAWAWDWPAITAASFFWPKQFPKPSQRLEKCIPLH